MLHNAAGNAGQTIAIAASGGRTHYVLGLWPVGLADDLAAWLEVGDRKVQLWVERHPHLVVDFPLAGGTDPFFNANTPEDLATAERMLRGKAA
jgi:molybdopterin-guanine dinucleotide biosynthesis protein A